MATFGHFALFLALVCSGWAATAAWLGTVSKGRGLERSAERGIIAACALIALAVLSLEHGFVTDDFSLDSVYHYSSVSQPLPYKIA
jgi:cytochrome c biogenesis factor